MVVKVWQPAPGARGVDTVSTISKDHACWLKNQGCEFVIRYLGNLSPAERDVIFGAGLALGLVTFAKAWNGLYALQELSALSWPVGATVFLDVEDVSLTPETLIGAIQSWTRPIAAAGYDPGGYFGSKCLLTSEEMYALPLRKYWHSCSRVVDRNGKEAGPQCGWIMRQLFPPNIDLPCGLRVDLDVVEHDYSGRSANFVKES